jgi:hypothetical protein
MVDNLPQTSVLYVKNGEHGRWWPVAKSEGQIHAGWSNIPHDLLKIPNYEKIKQLEIEDYQKRGKPIGAGVADANALWRYCTHLASTSGLHLRTDACGSVPSTMAP